MKKPESLAPDLIDFCISQYEIALLREKMERSIAGESCDASAPVEPPVARRVDPTPHRSAVMDYIEQRSRDQELQWYASRYQRERLRALEQQQRADQAAGLMARAIEERDHNFRQVTAWRAFAISCALMALIALLKVSGVDF